MRPRTPASQTAAAFALRDRFAVTCLLCPQRTVAKTRYKRQWWLSVAPVLRSPAEGGGSVRSGQFVTFLPVLLRPCDVSKVIKPLMALICYDVTTPTPQGHPPPIKASRSPIEIWTAANSTPLSLLADLIYRPASARPASDFLRVDQRLFFIGDHALLPIFDRDGLPEPNRLWGPLERTQIWEPFLHQFLRFSWNRPLQINHLRKKLRHSVLVSTHHQRTNLSVLP